MGPIGYFRRSAGDFVGEIITLSVQSKDVRIVSLIPQPDAGLPTHRVYVGRAVIGHGWHGGFLDGEALKLELDDPSFSAPIHAVLRGDGRGAFELLWSRPERPAP